MFHISIDDDKVSPIKIIESEANSSGIPAAEAIEQVGALAQNNNNNDDDGKRLEKATSNLYSMNLQR